MNNGLHYTLPPTLPRDIARYETDIRKFEGGRLHDTAFTARRVKMGVYQERGGKTYMCRIRCAGNIITPSQLIKAADLADTFGESRVHVTTRSELQIHGIGLKDTVRVIRALLSAELTTKGGGGHTIRNIETNHDSGTHPAEPFDVQPYAVALTSRLIAAPDSFDLPRKFKIAFSSLPDRAGHCAVQDLGFVAALSETGEKGFRVYAGGGLGTRPQVGILLHEFIPAAEMYAVALAVKTVFIQHGNRRNKHHARLRFLIHDDMGENAFRAIYEQTLADLKKHPDLSLPIAPIVHTPPRKCPGPPTLSTRAVPGYDEWQRRQVRPQKQPGLFSIRLPLNLGDLSSADCRYLGRALLPFGENTLRCGHDQNLYIRNIPGDCLPPLYQGLKRLETLTEAPVFHGRMVPCTGAQTCQLGINYPRPAMAAIFNHLNQTDIDPNALEGIRVHISGCPNSCANHWAADLGFYGMVRRMGHRPMPTYNVVGGAVMATGTTRLARLAGWVHAKDLPRFIGQVLSHFLEYRQGVDSEAGFATYWEAAGKAFATSLCRNRFNRIPDFEENPDYYYDHGATEQFSTKNIMGKAECSAGLYDMIDVDDKAVRSRLADLASDHVPPENREPVLLETAFHACRMLLVTRGEEPATDREVYNCFIRHFIDTGLVDKRLRDVVELIRDKGSRGLADHEARIVDLGRAATALYHRMDDTLQFPKPGSEPVINQAVTSGAEAGKTVNRFKDLRGVKCPLNYAHAKVELSGMATGETLEILLDDGEPVENVPGSFKLDGHQVLRREKVEGYWSILIQKG